MSERVRLSPLVCRGLCFGTGWLLAHDSAASASQLLRRPVDAPPRGSEAVTVVSTLWKVALAVSESEVLSWQVYISAECQHCGKQVEGPGKLCTLTGTSISPVC